MRKVIFRYWIPAEKEVGQFKPKEGTGCFSHKTSGFFHCWGYEVHEDGNSVASESVAIVESVDTGHIWKVQPERIRFVQPPETRVHKNEKLIGEEAFTREEIGKDLDIAVSRVELLAPKTEQVYSIISVLKDIRRRL
jgi:hypothetical protein